MDPIEFLRRYPPFDQLDESQLARVRASLEIDYHEAGKRLLTCGGAPCSALRIVRKGAVRLERDGKTLLVVEPGQPFGVQSLLTGEPPEADALAVEDVLEYRVAGAVFRGWMADSAVSSHFARRLSDRLRRHLSLGAAPAGDELRVEVGSLVQRPAVQAAPETPVRDVAVLMRSERVSSILVTGEPRGIVTDRDLRNRVLAAGLDPATPVSRIVSSPVTTVGADAPVFDALLLMLEHNFHHLPVVRDGQVIGVVSNSDILRHESKAPVFLRACAERAREPRDLAGYAQEVAAVVGQLAASGVDALEIGRVVATLNDAAVRSLVRLAERALGPPPCGYAWLALGSEGRREQTLLTDQDNALVHASDSDAARKYFEQFAERVVEGLVTAGIPRCPGNVMATHHRGTEREWCDKFRGWIALPDPAALLQAAIFFDYRLVHSTMDLPEMDRVVATASGDGVFRVRLAAASLSLRPPLGWFGRLKDSGGGVDLKSGGIVPIVALARAAALQARSAARSTVDRLRAAAEGGLLSADGAGDLIEGLRFLMHLRLRHQLAAMQSGAPVTNTVNVDALAPAERHHLKEVFASVRDQQEAYARQFPGGLLADA